MNKQEFLAELRKGLSGLPQDDIEERLIFYNEMLEDRIEEGLSEEEAVSAIGSVEEIAAQTIADTPLTKIAKERIRPNRRLKAYEIILLTLGSPIWLPLGLAAAAVMLSLYIVLWAVIVSVWAVWGSAVIGTVGGIAAGILFAIKGNGISGLATAAAGMICAGLSIFLFYGCKAASTKTFKLTKKFVLWIKNCIIRKEEA